MNAIEICGAKLKYRHVTRDVNSNLQTNGYINGKPKAYKRDEALAIRSRFPTKIPVIVDKYYKETDLPILDKKKFLVPEEITMSQFIQIIRNRMKLHPTKALFLLINNKAMVSISRTVGEIYEEYKDTTGFLYVVYTSEEVYG